MARRVIAGLPGLAWVDRNRPEALVLLLVAIAGAVGLAWGLPGGHSWAADSISPRSCGLGAIVETYWPGHYHERPPLHMLVLTVLSLPWIGLAVAQVGVDPDRLTHVLIEPLPMTGIEITARLVTLAMAVGVAASTMRLWRRLAGRQAAIVAGLTIASNAVFIYYAHTGNLDVPALFWTAWCLLEVDRFATGEIGEQRVLLLAVAAALTKDQAAGALVVVLPVFLVLLPWLASRASPLRPALVRAALLAVGVYALVSGALINPVGFWHRLAFLFGPGSQSWAGYQPGAAGALALIRDAIAATPHFTAWPIAVAAGAGVIVALRRAPPVPRARLLLPLVAAVSFFVLFDLAARRSEDRFLLPVAVLVLPYAGLLWQRASGVAGARIPAAVVLAAGFALAALGVASVDGTLLVDSRYAAEDFLAALPPGTPIEVYGGPIYLPRIPAGLAAVRPGIEPIAERQPIAGVAEIVDPAMDPRPRAPEYIVLATELSDVAMTRPPPASQPYGLMQYRDARSRRFLRDLYDGALGYVRVLDSRCALPWPLACRTIHASTGRDVWIYARVHS